MKTLIILLLLPFPVFADWTIHTVSTHLKTDGVNNINPGIAYDFDYIRVGGVYNSYENLSLYVVGIADITSSFRVGAGAISGYKFKNNDVAEGDSTSIIPFIAFEYDITDNVSVVLFGEVLNLALKF